MFNIRGPLKIPRTEKQRNLFRDILQNSFGQGQLHVRNFVSSDEKSSHCSPHTEYLEIPISERDWRLFKEKMPDWQERYMAQLNEEYIKLLSAGIPASHKFWELEKRINQDKRNTGVVAEMKRSNMYFCIVDMLKQKIITVADLEGFSEELVDSVTYIYG